MTHGDTGDVGDGIIRTGRAGKGDAEVAASGFRLGVARAGTEKEYEISTRKPQNPAKNTT